MSNPYIFAISNNILGIVPAMANRHGLIAGATGTGKTVTLRVLAEAFSAAGVPVFMADAKGDLSGLAKAGMASPKIAQRISELAIEDFSYGAAPVAFWDVFGTQGHPVRTTVSEMGPLLLARLLDLNETQASVLSLVFKIADDHGLLLLDMKDLRAMVQYVGEHAAEFKTEFGNISTASIGAIQRGLVALDEQGGDVFFGEPALNLDDLIQTNEHGHGIINLLAADKLMQSPKLYATFLLWMLSELFEILPEAGDLEKPKLVFFFDEAHLLFSDAPKALLEKIEQVVRLIRSKGVGIYFVTQNPLDIPAAVLGQLGNRVQHALRAFTPKDQKAVRAAAETFRANPKLNIRDAITELGVGEALVSLLDEKGTPSVVERAWIYPPRSRLAPLTTAERTALIKTSAVYGHYEKPIDRASAYEALQKRAESGTPATADDTPARRTSSAPRSAASGLFETFAKGAARAIGSQIGRQIVRGVLGSLLGGSTPRRRR
ncbi:MAG: helicase HerA-like domain-containing protein [Pseudomonadota bacterium]